MRRRAARGFFLALCLFGASGLACNLMGSGADSLTALPAPSTNTPALTAQAQSDTRPEVRIDAPPPGSQAVAGRRVLVRVQASDAIGITRVEMREGGRIVGVQSAPAPAKDFEALIPFTPNNVGVVRLEVLAYRRGVASDPAQLDIEIVRSERELRNPSSLDATAGVASGLAICTAQVNVNQLNMRRGPGTSFDVLAHLALSESLTVVGRNADSSWFLVRRASLQEGWVSGEYLIEDGDCSRAPVVTPTG